ncbi:MAG: hypothetical protein QNJ55_36475 [Xenococcus sp. MO_188.B8]|nr:hypothetical protein [Xenococcus sp. MO_188.B8]
MIVGDNLRSRCLTGNPRSQDNNVGVDEVSWGLSFFGSSIEPSGRWRKYNNHWKSLKPLL